MTNSTNDMKVRTVIFGREVKVTLFCGVHGYLVHTLGADRKYAGPMTAFAEAAGNLIRETHQTDHHA